MIISRQTFRMACLLTAVGNAGGNLILMLFYVPLFELVKVPLPTDLPYFYWMAGLSFSNGVLAYLIYRNPERNSDLLKVGIVGKGLFAAFALYFYAFMDLHWFFLLFGIWDGAFVLIFALFLLQLQAPDITILNTGTIHKGTGSVNKKAAIISHSMTGTGSAAIGRIEQGLKNQNYAVDIINVQVEEEELFKFPFNSILQFLQIAIRAIFRRPAKIKPLPLDANHDYDLLIVQGQTWMVGVGAPIEAVFQDPANTDIFKGRDAAVVIVARGLVRRSQVMLINHLKDCQANVIGTRTYKHIGKEPSRLLSLAAYLVFGKVGKPSIFEWFLQPRYGLGDKELNEAEAFGEALANR